jgi:hypothetical protein
MLQQRACWCSDVMGSTLQAVAHDAVGKVDLTPKEYLQYAKPLDGIIKEAVEPPALKTAPKPSSCRLSAPGYALRPMSCCQPNAFCCAVHSTS